MSHSQRGKCQKHSHKTYHDAKKHMERLRSDNMRRKRKYRVRNDSPRDLRIYQCWKCAGWHVGHWRQDGKSLRYPERGD